MPQARFFPGKLPILDLSKLFTPFGACRRRFFPLVNADPGFVEPDFLSEMNKFSRTEVRMAPIGQKRAFRENMKYMKCEHRSLIQYVVVFSRHLSIKRVVFVLLVG